MEEQKKGNALEKCLRVCLREYLEERLGECLREDLKECFGKWIEECPQGFKTISFTLN